MSYVYPTKKGSQYEPDKNGYFVCVTNKLVANLALCDRYRSYKPLDVGFSANCADCSIDLTQVTTKSLENFASLEQELMSIL